jgi:hypothetical protein
VALLTELIVSGEDPREQEDQLPKPSRAEAGRAADHQGHHDEAKL